MIQLTSISKSFGARVLFNSLTWQINSGERIGLCGPNGAGKTTLLRIMAGIDEPDDGTLAHPSDLTFGFLPQEGITHSGRTLFDETCSAFDELLKLQTEMRELENQMADTEMDVEKHESVLSKYSAAQDSFQNHGGYDIESRVHVVLQGLGFKTKDLSRQTEVFSGGWQMRIALAKLLLKRPKLLLMDEPTNHLDLEARNWLEDFLVSYPHAVVLVSHDHFFLDRVVTSIAEVNLRTLVSYPGNYSNFLIERDRRLSQLREKKRRQDEETARMQAFIDRFRYQATKASQVQSRIKMLQKVVPIEVPPERKRVHFTFPASKRSGRTVIELKDISKRYGDVQVFSNVAIHIERGDRIALVGQNGSGKSTLMRILAGVEEPDAGTRKEGTNVITQYFAQDEASRLQGSNTVYENLSSGSPVNMVPAIRNILGGFLFEGDDINKKVSVLSGGEKTRLAVARLLLHSSNTLLLDEPTNHLDIDSTNVLLNALSDYGGTLIFVSHDRYFVDRLATKILDISEQTASLYPGSYEEFQWSHSQSVVSKNKSNQTFISNPKQPQQNETREKKRYQSEKRKLEKHMRSVTTRISDIENRIAEKEQAIGSLEKEISNPNFYNDKAAAQTSITEHQNLMWEVGDLMNQWEALNKEAAEFADQIQKKTL
ncbi:MAG: ABC transporter ATP-binding protein [Rhodospirillaceae bacterium]|nr:ABC transporter ATP-binding protein [Rhodospirillaceae bacterium]|tara:strand:- start:2388 stop:4355 length:1968 start_codon:yes stop_codon:yes gene_type:complete